MSDRKLVAQLAQARIPFALDFSFGDPGESMLISLESVIDRPAIPLQAYPLALNLAEKIVTAMQRRETSTRDRTSRTDNGLRGDGRTMPASIAARPGRNSSR